MNIKFMWAVDYWMGVPLCFLLTCLDKIFRLFPFKKIPTGHPRRILLIKPTEMGAVIQTYPLVRKMQKEYPQCEIFFLVFEENRPVFEVLPMIPMENVLTIRNHSLVLFVLDTFSALFKIRRKKVDMVLDLEFFSRFTAIISYLSGAPQRTGFHPYHLEGLYRGDFFTHKIAYNPHLHIRRQYLSFRKGLGIPGKSTPEWGEAFDEEEIAMPQFIPQDHQIQVMRHRLSEAGVKGGGKIFLINPGAGRLPLREWPGDNFAELAQRFMQDPANRVIIIGTLTDADSAEKLYGSIRCHGLARGVAMRHVQYLPVVQATGKWRPEGSSLDRLKREHLINWNGKTTLPELLTLFTLSSALITNDGGLAHLASLTSIKQFVLFGPESPAVFSPWGGNPFVFYSNLPCSPCLSAYNHRRSACLDNLCLKKITPGEVFQAVCQKCSP